jgi:hypothetical protein
LARENPGRFDIVNAVTIEPMLNLKHWQKQRQADPAYCARERLGGFRESIGLPGSLLLNTGFPRSGV